MKRTVTLLMALMLMLTLLGAFAEMGVQLINGSEEEMSSVSLDDFKLNTSTPVDGFGTLTGTSFEFTDQLRCYPDSSEYYNIAAESYINSGEEADFAVLKMDILNNTSLAKNYLSSCDVSVIFDDSIEFKGWFYQYDWNRRGDGDGKSWVINSEDQFSIDPMYTGHYCFGCTLPNTVVEDKASLKMIIMLDGNEISFDIRK